MSGAPDLFGEQPRQLAGRGYAGKPGKGPAGETCGTCAYICGGRYKKCGHANGKRTRGPGTDILVSAPACEFWFGALAPRKP